MNTFDAVIFGAALLTLAGFWIRHEVQSNRRRKLGREMLSELRQRGHVAALLLCAGAAWGQEWRPPQPGPLCGQRISTPQTALVEIACPDFDALAKLGVPAAGRQMQVLVHAKYGDAVRVEAFYVDAEGKEASFVKFADLTRDSYGRLIAMPAFPGWGYTRLKVNVKRDAE